METRTLRVLHLLNISWHKTQTQPQPISAHPFACQNAWIGPCTSRIAHETGSKLLAMSRGGIKERLLSNVDIQFRCSHQSFFISRTFAIFLHFPTTCCNPSSVSQRGTSQTETHYLGLAVFAHLWWCSLFFLHSVYNSIGLMLCLIWLPSSPWPVRSAQIKPKLGPS